MKAAEAEDEVVSKWAESEVDVVVFVVTVEGEHVLVGG